MTSMYTYTFEIATLLHISADSSEDANTQLHELIEELEETAGNLDVVTKLCHIMSDEGRSVYISSEEFIPYPLKKTSLL